jgi:hypothetical protein
MITEENQEVQDPDLPEDLADTEVHMMATHLGYVMTPLTEVPDILNGGKRTRRFGAWVGINLIPDLDKQSGGPGMPLIIPEPPNVFVAGDSLEDVANRIKFEIDAMVETCRQALAGELQGDDSADNPTGPATESDS